MDKLLTFGRNFEKSYSKKNCVQENIVNMLCWGIDQSEM